MCNRTKFISFIVNIIINSILIYQNTVTGLYVMSIVPIRHFLIVSSYIGTSLPGPAKHCNILPEYYPPKYWTDAFFRIKIFDGIGVPHNIIFNGYILQMVTVATCITYNSPKIFILFFWINQLKHLIVLVDVVVWFYVSIMLFVVYRVKMQFCNYWYIVQNILYSSYGNKIMIWIDIWLSTLLFANGSKTMS